MGSSQDRLSLRSFATPHTGCSAGCTSRYYPRLSVVCTSKYRPIHLSISAQIYIVSRFQKVALLFPEGPPGNTSPHRRIFLRAWSLPSSKLERAFLTMFSHKDSTNQAPGGRPTELPKIFRQACILRLYISKLLVMRILTGHTVYVMLYSLRV